MTLNELTIDTWQPVALRVRVNNIHDGWAYLLPEGEIDVFHLAVEGGRVLKATQPGNPARLVAKLARVG